MRLGFDPARGGADPRDVVLREAVFTGSVSALVAAAEGEADADAEASPLGSGGGPLTLDASRLTLRFAPPAAAARSEATRPTPESMLAEGGVTASRASTEAGAAPLWTLDSEEPPRLARPLRRRPDHARDRRPRGRRRRALRGRRHAREPRPAPPRRRPPRRLAAARPRRAARRRREAGDRGARRRRAHRRHRRRRAHRRAARGPRPGHARPRGTHPHRRRRRRREDPAHLDRVPPLRRRHRRGRSPRRDAHHLELNLRGGHRAPPHRGRGRASDLRAGDRRVDPRRGDRFVCRLRQPTSPPRLGPRRGRQPAGGGRLRNPRTPKAPCFPPSGPRARASSSTCCPRPRAAGSCSRCPAPAS